VSVGPGLDYRNNSLVTNPDPDEDPAWVKIWENFMLTYNDIKQSFEFERDTDEEKRSRGYVFVNNPRVDPFGEMYNDTTGEGVRVRLQLAINTNQFGRTFQDRTHCFQILERPGYIDNDDEIIFVSVQGKRGNIVQVYPATEYFFIPEPIDVSEGDFVHFCWTGSNTNPNNNDGQGKQGTDRSNICPLTDQQYDKEEGPYSIVDGNWDEFNQGAVGDLGNNYPNYVQDPYYDIPEYYDFANKREVTASRMLGFDQELLNELCTQRRIGEDNLLDYGNMEELDDAGTTYCVEPVEVKAEGIWNFLCTRNNNFSNRSQKGSASSSDSMSTDYAINSNGYNSADEASPGEAVIVVQAGMVEESDTLLMSVITWANTGEESTIIEIAGYDDGEFSADTLVDGGWIELWIPYTPKSLHTPYVDHKADDDSNWKYHKDAALDYNSDLDTYYAVTNINEGGYYKAVNQIDWGMILIFILFLLSVVACTGYLIFTKCRKQ